MIDPESGLGLPLVHHLMEHGVLDLRPGMVSKVTPADSDLHWRPGPDAHRQLTETGAHPAGKPDRNLAQRPTEVPSVQILVKRDEAVQQDQIARPGLLPGTWPGPRRRVILDRERQEFALRRPPQHPRDSRIEEAYDRLQDLVRCVGVASMNAEHPPAETEHHRAVGVGDDPIDISESELLQPERQVILEQKQLSR